MIFNTAVYGGIKEEDITAEFLRRLDPNFTEDNIAEGVDLFGLVGTHSGAKIAKGSVTASNSAVTISGLDFTPTEVVLVLNTVWTYQGVIVHTYGTTGYYSKDQSGKTIGITYAFTAGGFTATCASTAANFNGTYYWVAWGN